MKDDRDHQDDDRDDRAPHRPLLARALRVLGDAERVERWLRQPNPDLRGRAPAELLTSDLGRREVAELLARMERGAYA